jgi:hypothetical protein
MGILNVDSIDALRKNFGVGYAKWQQNTPFRTNANQ